MSATTTFYILGLVISAGAALATSPMGQRFFERDAERQEVAHIALVVCSARVEIHVDLLRSCFNRLAGGAISPPADLIELAR